MKKLVFVLSLLLVASGAAFAQHDHGATKDGQKENKPAAEKKTNEQNAPVDLKAGETITRGSALAKNVKQISVEKAFADPKTVEGKTVEVKGVIVRSCKTEGCWMELADKEGGRSVRVTFGDHAFFIPLNAAGLKARAQGTFKTNVLTKDKVDHLIAEDGAKFPNRNADGTVTEVSFDATGVELKKQ